jgi:hypothetical protein
VYREVSPSGAEMSQDKSQDKSQYKPVAVKLLGRVGDGWLVEGLGRADSIVVQGAGVLWSFEGIGTFSAAEEEHD